MGKGIRKIWLGLLSGVAALTSCNLQTAPPCYYGPPNDGPKTMDSVEMPRKARIKVIKERLKAIEDILEERRNSEVYGSPEYMEEYNRETMHYVAEADSLNKELETLEKK